MGGACATYGGGDKRCMEKFGVKTWGKDTTWKMQESTGE